MNAFEPGHNIETAELVKVGKLTIGEQEDTAHLDKEGKPTITKVILENKLPSNATIEEATVDRRVFLKPSADGLRIIPVRLIVGQVNTYPNEMSILAENINPPLDLDEITAGNVSEPLFTDTESAYRHLMEKRGYQEPLSHALSLSELNPEVGDVVPLNEKGITDYTENLLAHLTKDHTANTIGMQATQIRKEKEVLLGKLTEKPGSIKARVVKKGITEDKGQHWWMLNLNGHDFFEPGIKGEDEIVFV